MCCQATWAAWGGETAWRPEPWGAPMRTGEGGEGGPAQTPEQEQQGARRLERAPFRTCQVEKEFYGGGS